MSDNAWFRNLAEVLAFFARAFSFLTPASANHAEGGSTVKANRTRRLVPRLAFLIGIAFLQLPVVYAQLEFVPVTPCRVVDTRNPPGPFSGPELAAGTSTEFDIPQGPCSIPTNAVAYSFNVTVIPDGILGYLTLWPTGQDQPAVSTLNSDGRIKANAAITPAGTNGGVNVFVTDASQVILDINGYFVPPESDSFAYYPITPCRIVDTRNPVDSLGGPSLVGLSSRVFPILQSSCGIDPSVQAYSLNVTVIPQGPFGYLSIWPSDEDQPLVSTLNATTGVITANAAIVLAGSDADGSISVYASDPADLLIDVNGYFEPQDTNLDGLDLYPVTPCRVLDTRDAGGAYSGELLVDVQNSVNNCAPSPDAFAYVLNATVVPSGGLGYLTLWPDGDEDQPGVSTLNALDGAVTSNLAIVPTNLGGVETYATDPTQLILDISSYFGLAPNANVQSSRVRGRSVGPHSVGPRLVRPRASVHQ